MSLKQDLDTYNIKMKICFSHYDHEYHWATNVSVQDFSSLSPGFEICFMADEVELLTSDPSSLTSPLYNVFLLSLAVNVMSRCSHKSQVHQNWSSLHNIFTLRDMKWVLFQNFCHIIKTKLVGKLLARLCCLLLRRGSEELLHLLGCCRNLAVDRWLKHGFRDPDSTDHQGKLFEIKDQGGKKVCTTISCFEWCGDIRMTSVSHCTRKLKRK